MTRRPKDIGTAAETAVVRAARSRGFGLADRLTLTGQHDRGDVRLTPGLVAGVIAEVKGGNSARQASDRMVRAWLAEAEQERTNADADVAILVTQRAGYAPARADQWWAYTTAGTLADLLDSGVMPPDPGEPVRVTLAALLRLLRAAGYGDPIDTVMEATA